MALCVWCGEPVRGGHLVADMTGPGLVACSVTCAERVPRRESAGPEIRAWLWCAARRTLCLVTDDDDTTKILTVTCGACSDTHTHRPDVTPHPPWRRLTIVGVVGSFHACSDEHEQLIRRRYERPEGGDA